MPLSLKRVPSLTSLFDAALDFVFPISCVGCTTEGAYLCPDCLPRLPALRQPYCALCAQPNSSTPCRWCLTSPLALDGVAAAFTMEGAVRESVLQLKYHQVRGLAPTLAGLMEPAWQAKGLTAELVVPVPLHPRRLRQRGYNQSALLAKALSMRLNLPCDESVLVRIRDTGPQVGLSREKRALNVQNCFQASDAPNGNAVKGKSVVVVDDVATTGSTLSACAQALRRQGASSVWGLVLAREGRPSPQSGRSDGSGQDTSRPFSRPWRRRKERPGSPSGPSR